MKVAYEELWTKSKQLQSTVNGKLGTVRNALACCFHTVWPNAAKTNRFTATIRTVPFRMFIFLLSPCCGIYFPAAVTSNVNTLPEFPLVTRSGAEAPAFDASTDAPFSSASPIAVPLAVTFKLDSYGTVTE